MNTLIALLLLSLVVVGFAYRPSGLFGERYMFLGRPKRVFVDNDNFSSSRAMCLRSYAGVFFPDYCSDK